jgi:RNA ligase (TIGR02306 family)
MKDASIQIVSAVDKHPNADSLDICSVLGFKCITKLGQYKVGDVICYIAPDSVLPEKEWSAFYRAKSSRVKAVKLRQIWSEGIIETLERVGYTGPVEIGRDISADIGVSHYDPPLPQDLSAKGLLPFGIPKTDEERVEGLNHVPWGEIVDIGIKRDGQSASYYWYVDSDNIEHCGVLGRTMEYKSNSVNNYTQNQANYDIINKVSAFCRRRGLRGLCVRGESYGAGINRSTPNHDAKEPLRWAMYSTWLIDERQYARKGHDLYFLTIADELGLPIVPILERDVPLTPELVTKYATSIEQINGKPFEGVVAQGAFGSCKILSKSYDSKKG